MSNPSTIWTQLSLPYSPIGSLPFVDVDGVTINTDVLNFYYTNATMAAQNTGTSRFAGQVTAAGGFRQNGINLTAAPAVNVNLSAPAGKISIPIGSSTCQVTNSFVAAGAVVLCQLESADATLTRITVSVNPVGGQFTISGNANATAVARVSFVVLNIF